MKRLIVILVVCVSLWVNAQTPYAALNNFTNGAVLTDPITVLAQGNYAYVFNGGAFNGGLETVDITNPVGPKHKTTMSGTSGGVAFINSSIYVVSNTFGAGTLSSISLANPAAPTVVGSYLLSNPGLATGAGSYAYVVTASNTKLEIINTSNPAAMSSVGTLTQSTSGAHFGAYYSPPSGGRATGIVVDGNYCYVVSDEGLEIIDVTTKTAPVHKSFTSSGRLASLAVSYPYAYTFRNDGYLIAYNISNPVSPSVISTTFITLAMPTSTYKSGNYLYLGFPGVPGLVNKTRIIRVDVSNPAAPAYANLFTDVNGANFMSFAPFGNRICLVKETYAGMKVINIANPGATYVEGRIANGSGGALLSNPRGMKVIGTKAYVTSVGDSSFQIIDIADPLHPTPLGNIVHGTGGAELKDPVNLFVALPYAYITSGNYNNYNSNTLEIVDVSDPNNPVHKGKISGGNLTNPRAVAVAGTNAFVVSGGGMQVVNVSNPALPVPGAFLPSSGTSTGPCLGSAMSIVISGNYAYIPSCNALNIIDISNPTNPTFVSKVANAPVAQTPTAVFVSGNYAYVTCEFGVEIFDISVKTNPVHLSYVISAQYGRSIVVSGKYAYTSGKAPGYSALVIIDVSNPATPRQKSYFGAGAISMVEAVDVLPGNYFFPVGESSFAVYQFLPIEITSFSPASGTAGSSVIITGTNFSSTLANNIVKFNGVTATITAASSTSLTVTVPTGATNGEIVVSKTGEPQTAWSSSNFIIKPTVTFTSASSGVYNSTINFAINKGGSTGAVTYSVANGTGTATVSGSVLSLTGAGTVTVTANVAADANYGATSVQQIVTIAKASQTITFNTLPSKTYGNAPYTISATSSSGLAVTLTSLTPAELSLSVATSPATATILNGEFASVTIRASQAGNANYNPAANVDQPQAISKASITATANSTSWTYGSAVSLPVSFSGFVNGDNASSLDTAPAISGYSSCTNAGSYAITPSGGVSKKYLFTYATGSLTIDKASLTATADNRSKIYGEGMPGLSFSYSGFVCSDNASVIDSPPSVSTPASQYTSVGSYPINIGSAEEDNNYTFTYKAGTLTIVPATQWIPFGAIPNQCNPSGTIALPQYSSAGLAVSYTSLNPYIVTISGNILTVIGAGFTVITASQSGNANVTAALNVDQPLSVSSGIGYIYRSADPCVAQPVYLTAGDGSNYSWGAQTIAVYGTGTYGVNYTDIYGCSVSASIDNSCSGGGVDWRKGNTESDDVAIVDVDPLAGQFALFPNPANKEVTIHLQEPINESGEVHLINVMGNVLAHGTMKAGEVQTKINTENLVAGAYVLQINTGKKLIVKKVVVMH